MDQSATVNLLNSNAELPQRSLDAQSIAYSQQMAPQKAAIQRSQLNALQQSLADQQIIKNRLLQDANGQYQQANGGNNTGNQLDNTPSNTWKPPQNYAEMVADQQYQAAESKRTQQYQAQIKPWVDYAVKIGGKEGARLFQEIGNSVLSDANAPVVIKRQLKPFIDDAKSGKLEFGGDGVITVSTQITPSIQKKYGMPEESVGQLMSITTKNGEFIQAVPIKHQTGDAMTPEAYAQKVSLAEATAKAKARYNPAGVLSPEAMAQREKLAGIRSSYITSRITPFSTNPDYGHDARGQVYKYDKENGYYAPAKSEDLPDGLLAERLRGQEESAKVKIRNSPLAVAYNDAYNLLSENKKTILDLSKKIRSKNPLLNFKTANAAQNWLGDHLSDPDVSKFIAKMTSLAEVLSRTSLGGGRGGSWTYAIAQKLLNPATGTDALESVLDSHIDDLGIRKNDYLNFGKEDNWGDGAKQVGSKDANSGVPLKNESKQNYVLRIKTQAKNYLDAKGLPVTPEYLKRAEDQAAIEWDNGNKVHK